MAVLPSFFMPKYNQREEQPMFIMTDEIIEKLCAREDVQAIPTIYQVAMTHAIQEVLKDVNENMQSTGTDYQVPIL